MLIFTKKKELTNYLSALRKDGKQVGFVPTMGALHQGHISLIEASKRENDITVCSIFVNPTQFNDTEDLKNYPREPEKDQNMLVNANCEALFMPDAEEMYKNEPKPTFNFGNLDKVLEGHFRPGHFNGVAWIVKLFLELVKPDKAYFGSKDYQQLLIIKALVKQLSLPVTIVACPILREADGLAMSSRNALLNAQERQLASNIPQIMAQAAKFYLSHGIEATKQFVHERFDMLGLGVEYYEVCDTEDLSIVSDASPKTRNISLIAVRVGKIRLIDNLQLN